MPINFPNSPRRRTPDPATEAMGNLFVAGIDTERLAPFEEAFGYEYCVTLPILEEGMDVFRALGIRELKPTWQRTVRSGHSLYIADQDFNPAGARRILQTLREIAERSGISVRPSLSEAGRSPASMRPQGTTLKIPESSGPTLERPVVQRQTAVRSRFLGLLRDFFPDHFANAIAYNLSDAAVKQLVHETYALQPKREWLAAKLVKKYWKEKCRAVAIDPRATKFNVVDSDGSYAGFSIKISALPPFKVQLFKVQQIGRRFITEEVFRKTVYHT